MKIRHKDVYIYIYIYIYIHLFHNKKKEKKREYLTLQTNSATRYRQRSSRILASKLCAWSDGTPIMMSTRYICIHTYTNAHIYNEHVKSVMHHAVMRGLNVHANVQNAKNANCSPRSRSSPVNRALRDWETLKQWEINLAFAVTTRNLVARARSVSSASRRLSRPRCRRPLNRHRWVWPAKLIESTSNSLQEGTSVSGVAKESHCLGFGCDYYKAIIPIIKKRETDISKMDRRSPPATRKEPSSDVTCLLASYFRSADRTAVLLICAGSQSLPFTRKPIRYLFTGIKPHTTR